MNSTNNEILLLKGYKMTELGPLPEEWEVIKPKEYFKEIKIKVGLENRDKYRPVAVGELGLRFREEIYKNKVKLTENTDKYLIFPYCSICFGLGAKTLAVDVNCEKNSKYSVSAAYKIFAFDEKIFNPIFLRSYIKHVQHLWGSRLLVQSVRQGKKIDKIIFNELPLPLPPLSEQQKIAAVLSAVQEAKEKTRAVIDATKTLKKSMMKHLFTYGPVSPVETKNVPLKETEIGPVPEEWEVVRLGEVFDVQQGKQLSEKESKEGKIRKPFLRTSNLNWGYIDISSIDEMYFTLEEFNKLKLESGDILICEGGDIGRTALYRGELVECAYQNHLHRLRPKKDNVDVKFFVLWMNYAINQRKMYTHSANRTTIPNLSGSRLKEFIFPLPLLPVQQKIASILSAIDEKIQAEEAKEKALEDLFRSLLSHLMSGKIRVKDLVIGD